MSEAFDILSNERSRKLYDHQVRQEEQRRRQQRQQKRRQENMRRQQKEREKKERFRRQKEMVERAKSTYGRVGKLSSVEQLLLESEVMDPVSKLYKRHVLIMFVANKAAEKKGEEVYYFPFPFAGESREDASYGDVIWTAKVRFNSQTDLTRLFKARSRSDEPHIIFAKKGDPIHKYQTFHPERHSVDVHGEFKQWVQNLLHIQVRIVNYHSLPVGIFVIGSNNRRVEHMHESLSSKYQLLMQINTGDRIIAYDTRIDSFPGGRKINEEIVRYAESVALLDTIVTSDEIYIVPPRRCYDLSSQCTEWKLTLKGMKSQCNKNQEFMHSICPLTCGVCTESFASDISYYAFHYPIHRVPQFLQRSVQGVRFFLDDITNIAKLRKNAAAAFFVVGVLLSLNIVLIKSALKSWRTNSTNGSDGSRLSFVLDTMMLILFVGVCIGMKWMCSVSVFKVPPYLRSLHGDFNRIAQDSDVLSVLLAAGFIACAYFRALFSSVASGGMNAAKIGLFIALLLALGCGMLGSISFMMSTKMTSVIRWKHLWKYRKNAAVAFVVVGASFGVMILSIKRLLKPILKSSSTPLLLYNIAVVGGVAGLSSIDKHFSNDLLHVINFRKNAAAAFCLLGVLTGKLAMKLIDKLSSEKPQPQQKVKTL